MIDAALVFSAKTDIQGSHAVVLEKCGVVRAGTEGGNAKIGALANFLALLRRFGIRNSVKLMPLPNRQLRLRIGDFASDVIRKLFERVGAFDFEVAAPVAVGVDVGDAVRAQFFIVRFGPLGGAEKPRFLAVPRAINDGALRLPSGLHQLPKRARLFEHRDHPGNRIFCAVHPAIVMVSANHPLVGKSETLNFSNHVVDRLDLPVRFHFQMDLRRARANVVGDSESAAPSFRGDAAGERRQQWLRVRVRNWQYGNFCDGGGLLDLQPFRIFRGAHARRERIAGIERHVRDAPALHTVRGTKRSGRKGFAMDESILMRIGVDEAAYRAVLGGDFRLDSAPRVIVASDDDLALHGNAHAVELLVVFRNAVIDVDQRGGDVTVDGIRVVSWQLFGLLIRSEILGERGFLKFGGKLRTAFDQFDDAFFRRRK